MYKICPIMSYRSMPYTRIWCEEKNCALWNEEKQCCVINSALLHRILPKEESNKDKELALVINQMKGDDF